MYHEFHSISFLNFQSKALTLKLLILRISNLGLLHLSLQIVGYLFAATNCLVIGRLEAEIHIESLQDFKQVWQDYEYIVYFAGW